MKHKWKQTLLVLALAAAMLLAMPAAAMADDPTPGPLDLTSDVTLTIAPGPASLTGSEHPTRIPAANVVYDVYKVADAVQDGTEQGATGPVYDSYHYTLCADFTGLSPDISSHSALTAMTRESWHSLASAAAVKVFSASAPITPAQSAVASSASMTLSAGLYLVIARSSDLTAVDDYVKWDDSTTPRTLVGTIARSAQYEYTYAPELISLPASAAAIPAVFPGDSEPNYTTAGGGWYYTVSAMMKPSEEPRCGDLVIEKDLSVYEDSTPVSVVFRVQASKTDDGCDFSYDDYHMITFRAAEKKSLTLSGIFPVGASVTVTEVYPGPGYVLTGTVWSEEETGTSGHLVKAAENSLAPLTVTFTDRYDGKLLQGGGILNEYEFVVGSGGSTGYWQLTEPSAFPANP